MHVTCDCRMKNNSKSYFFLILMFISNFGRFISYLITSVAYSMTFERTVFGIIPWNPALLLQIFKGLKKNLKKKKGGIQ